MKCIIKQKKESSSLENKNVTEFHLSAFAKRQTVYFIITVRIIGVH